MTPHIFYRMRISEMCTFASSCCPTLSLAPYSIAGLTTFSRNCPLSWQWSYLLCPTQTPDDGTALRSSLIYVGWFFSKRNLFAGLHEVRQSWSTWCGLWAVLMEHMCFLYEAFILYNFACTCIYDRYQLPLALFGLISSLGLWEAFRFCTNRWELESRPVVRQILLRLIQLGELCIDCSSLSLDTLTYGVAVVG